MSWHILEASNNFLFEWNESHVGYQGTDFIFKVWVGAECVEGANEKIRYLFDDPLIPVAVLCDVLAGGRHNKVSLDDEGEAKTA